MNKKDYNLSADILRILAILGVVIIHTANAVFARLDFFGGLSWWIAIILNSLSRSSIPLFIILSGYFLLQKGESYRNALRRMVQRIGIPLFVWYILYSLWNGGEPTFSLNAISLFRNLVTVTVFDLSFFVILIGLYSIAPVFRSFLHESTKVTQRNLALIALCLGVSYGLMQYVLKICGQANFFTYFLPYTGFFLAGYYFGLTKLQVKKRWIIFTYLISLFLTILGGYVYYLLKKQDSTLLAHPGCLSFYTDSYLSINVTLMAVTLFILLMHTSFSWIKNNYAKRLIYSVARSSMGIFLIHTLILDILDRKFHLFDQITPIWLYLIIKVFVIFVLSYLLTLVIVRIPFVKRMLGEMK